MFFFLYPLKLLKYFASCSQKHQNEWYQISTDVQKDLKVVNLFIENFPAMSTSTVISNTQITTIEQGLGAKLQVRKGHIAL